MARKSAVSRRTPPWKGLDEGNPGAGEGGKTKGPDDGGAKSTGEMTWDGLKDASRS